MERAGNGGRWFDMKLHMENVVWGEGEREIEI